MLSLRLSRDLMATRVRESSPAQVLGGSSPKKQWVTDCLLQAAFSELAMSSDEPSTKLLGNVLRQRLLGQVRATYIMTEQSL